MGGIMKKLLFVFMLSLLVVSMAWGQTNPAPQTIPYEQSFGTTSFSTLPNGFAAWNGTGLRKTLATAESSIPTGDAVVTARTSTSATAGVSGLAISSDARAYIQTSSNATNGTNQLALALNTTGKTNILLSFTVRVELPPDANRPYGVVSQYRIGTTGTWNTISNGSIEYTNQSAGTITSFTDLALGSNANNESVVQIRWATWRSDGSGSSGGLSIDNIEVSGTDSGTPTAAAPTFDPPSGSYLEAQNVIITSATEDAVVYYSLASNAGPWTEYSTPLNVTESTTIWAYAVKDGMTDSPVTSAVYVFPTNVANIAALRASATGASLYRLTGEAILTYQNSNRNTKYIQDDTAAIVIDDPSGNITSSYDLYDGITGIIGTLGVYRSLLQFTPVTDPGAATSTDNVVIPEVRTLASLTSDDQGKLIKVNGTTITYGEEFVFPATAQNLTAEDATASRTLRTFVNADYAGLGIPEEPVNMICLVGVYDATIQVSPRFYSDFETIYDLPEGEQVTVDGVTLTLTGGSANTVDGNLGSYPAFNNGSFTPDQSIFLSMAGGGPWHFDVVTDAPWGAYCYAGVWYAVENTGGHIIFTIDPGKALVIPIVLGDEDPTLPVELSTFTVSLNAFNNAVLNWITQTETGVSGFYVYRNNSENLASAILVSHLIPATNSSEEHSYSFIDNELFSHGTYYYWLQVADIDGSESYHGPATLVYTGNDEPALPGIPTVTELRSVFPNPFNPNTNLSYSLAEEADVNVKIFNSRGQLVRTLNEGHKAIGHHSAAWDGKDENGNTQSTGVYFFRMQAGKKVFNSKAVLMK